jgi:hypothetical protein
MGCIHRHRRKKFALASISAPVHARRDRLSRAHAL